MLTRAWPDMDIEIRKQIKDFPGGSAVENLPDIAGDVCLIPGLGRFPGEGNWKLAPVILPGKSHG